MAKKAETVFRSRIYASLVALPNTKLFPIQQKTIRGTPDFLICCNSLFVALELKSEDGDLDPLQKHNYEDVWKAKGVFLVARPSNWKETYELLMEIATSNIEQNNYKKH